MIRVQPAPEPATFQDNVRGPGLRAIAEMIGEIPAIIRRGRKRTKIAERREEIPPEKFPDYWTRAIDDLLLAYDRICAYVCCYIEPVTGVPSVDHMVPKSKSWDKVYEWDNYRLACHLVNTWKNDLTSILDPFEVQDDWFELELVGFQIKPRGEFRPATSGHLEETLGILNKSECCELRRNYVENYWEHHIDLTYLTRRSPFVARELRRQNRLR
jgi:hypothetical protein